MRSLVRLATTALLLAAAVSVTPRRWMARAS
jgi:hypothetical protein